MIHQGNVLCVFFSQQITRGGCVGHFQNVREENFSIQLFQPSGGHDESRPVVCHRETTAKWTKKCLHHTESATKDASCARRIH